MSKKKKTWWLIRTKKEGKGLNHLLYGSSEKAVRQLIRDQREIYYVGQTTWRMICELTGCIRPTGQEWNTYATGPLLFDNGEFSTILYPQLTTDKE